jgi:hypothetical protein
MVSIFSSFRGLLMLDFILTPALHRGRLRSVRRNAVEA